MTLKGNPLLKVLIPLFIVFVILVVVLWPGEQRQRTSTQQARDPSLTLSEDELKALGIEGDTPEDTVATLVGQTRAMRQELDRVVASNNDLQRQNEELRQKNQGVDLQVNQALDRQQRQFQQTKQQLKQENQSLLASFQSQLEQIKSKMQSNPSQQDDMPIGLGLENGGQGLGSQVAWVDPLDQRPDEGRGGRRGESEPLFPTSFKSIASDAGDALSRAHSAIKADASGQPDESTVEPVYTIPENSTLTGSLSMTALLGRVPVDGTVNDPYPFKVMIGKDNLTANGIELPEVQAAVVSGTATGDWTLSCVRGNIQSMTFVFEDGTVRTVPTPEDVNQGGGSRNNGQNQTIGGGDSIGWISDNAGIPCVSGVRRSNAKEYLSTQGLLTAAGAGVATLIDDDSTSVTSIGTDGTVSQAMSGNQAMSQILTQGVGDMSRWVNKFYGEAFAAIYVPPGQKVAIHINKQLPIDYETEGRKVRYDSSTTHLYGLD